MHFFLKKTFYSLFEKFLFGRFNVAHAKALEIRELHRVGSVMKFFDVHQSEFAVNKEGKII